MKTICEIVRYNDLPRARKKSDNPVVGCMFAICEESQVDVATGPQDTPLADVYPHYLLFDFSEDEEPRLHKAFSGEDLHQGMWTVEASSIFNTFNQALKRLKDNWQDIQKGMKRLGGFALELEDILNPEQDDMKNVVRQILD